jgi:putative flippase GtrA
MANMKRLVLGAWRRYRQQILYLVVGGWNTAFTYTCFSLLYYLLHASVYPSIILALTYVIASVNGFVCFRYLVFKPVRHPLLEYARYQAVYLPLLAINMVVLPLALAYTHLNAYAVQALFAVFAIVAGYLGNKYFAFRKVGDDSRTPS